jgi:hypothetical protein
MFIVPLEEADSDTESGGGRCLKLGYLCGIFGALCHTIRGWLVKPADVMNIIEHHHDALPTRCKAKTQCLMLRRW